MISISSLTIEQIRQHRKNGAKLYLYGAGDAVSSYARIALATLSAKDLKIDGFFDDDDSRTGKTFEGYPIYSSSDTSMVDSGTLVIITSNYFRTIMKGPVLNEPGVIVSSMVRILEEAHPEEFVGLMSFEEVQRRSHTHKSKLLQVQGFQGEVYVNALDVQVTEKCTMKCVDCSNLMQYYQKPVDSDIGQLLKNLDTFVGAIDHLADARVIGGEPFLVRDLASVLNYLGLNPKVGHVTVYTNGTIVPRQDVLEALRDPKIVVEITDYDEHSRNLKRVCETLEAEKIKFFAHKPQNWTDSARIVKNNLNPNELSQMFDACCVNDALTILHGRIYHCPFSANAINLDAFDVSQAEYLDLEDFQDSASLRSSFKSWYFGRPHLDSCAYCLGRDYMQPRVIPGVQTKHVIKIPIVREQ